MKYCGFALNGQSHYGLVETVAGVEQITRLLLKPPEEANGDIEDLPSKRMDHLALAEAKLLAPVRPSKIICVGRNYREHAAELGNEVPVEPLLFFKPPSSLLALATKFAGPNFRSAWTLRGNRSRDWQEMLQGEGGRGYAYLHSWLYLPERRNRA